MSTDIENPARTRPADYVVVLLECLARSKGPLTLMEVARSIHQQKATTFKQLARLVEVGLVQRDADGLYRPGPKARGIAQQLLRASDGAGFATKILEDLRDATGETATIVGIDGDMARIVHRVESNNLISVNLRVGDRFELADSASALVLLSYGFTPAEREKLRADSDHIPSEDVMRDVIAAGYGYSIDKLVLGLGAVAVPYKIPEDPRHYALTLVAPMFRFDLESSATSLGEYAIY